MNDRFQQDRYQQSNMGQQRPGFGNAATDVGAGVDEGLRSYMLKVYNYMTSGVLLTGIVALVLAQLQLVNGLVMLVGVFGSLGLVLAMNFGMNKFSTSTLHIMFWSYTVLVGMMISGIFLQYTSASIAQTFFATAAAFAGLSLWGYTTKKDLSAMGTFLIMGLIGLIVAMVINIFLQSSTMSLVISAIGVLIFAGLTAYDTQKIKSIYFHVRGTDMMGKSIIMGALTLYLDFINLFLFLLRFMGSSRN